MGLSLESAGSVTDRCSAAGLNYRGCPVPAIVWLGRGSSLGRTMRAPRPPQLFFFGTFAPFLRASDNPIAIACLRLFTLPPFPPLPDFNVPFFLRSIALFTRLPAAFPYLRSLPFFL